MDSRIGSHCGQFDVHLLVDFVNTGKALGWGELVLVTELSRGEVVVLSDGGMLSLTRHHQGGYPTVQEMFLQVRDNKLQFEKKKCCIIIIDLLNILNKHFEIKHYTKVSIYQIHSGTELKGSRVGDIID